eukprot:141097_1
MATLLLPSIISNIFHIPPTVLYLLAILCCLIGPFTSESIATTAYGGIGGEWHDLYNQGRIYAINDWGYRNDDEWYKGLRISDWYSDNQTENYVYGIGTLYTACADLVLSNHDFIVGYKMWIQATEGRPCRLEFNTRNGHTFGCGNPIFNLSTTTAIHEESFNYGEYDFWYLSGWHIKSGFHVVQLGFQFTKATIAPTPTNNPTNMPTTESLHVYLTLPFIAPSVESTLNGERGINRTVSDRNKILTLVIGAVALICLCVVIRLKFFLKRKVKGKSNPHKQSKADNTKVKKQTSEKWTVTHPQKMIRVASRSSSTLKTTRSCTSSVEKKSEETEIIKQHKPYILTIDSVATLPEVVADSGGAHKESISMDNALNIANLFPSSLSTVAAGSVLSDSAGDRSRLKYEMKDEVTMELCADCKTYKLGRIYGGDELFYCDDCWKNYYGSQRVIAVEGVIK